MSKISDFLEYKKHQPEYKEWKENKENDLKKKATYLKSNPIPDDEFQKEVKRAKVVLEAVNTMDEYSQSRAEDMEEVAVSFEGLISEFAIYLGLIPAFITAKLTGVKEIIEEGNKNNFKNFFNKKNIIKMLPTAAVYFAVIAGSVIFSKFWSAKKQIEASRLGRTEAMVTDLASANQFAILNDEQQKEVEAKADTIHVDKKEARKAISATRGLGLFHSLKTIFAPDEKLLAKQIEFNKKINNEIQNVDSVQLSKTSELEAKKDQELIQTIVEKIDVASQDYAENAELAVDGVYAMSLGAGGGSFAIANKIMQKMKVDKKTSLLASGILGLGILMGGAVFKAKIEKQASRVGRFKAKQELLESPEQLVYVDKEKYQNTEISAPKEKKKNFFEFVIQLYKDNKEYNKYIENNNVRNVQMRKAKNEIKLTPQQEQRAKDLQNNVFKMFNKLDEKSQSFSEATEAIGESLKEILALVMTVPITIMATRAISSGKSLKAIDGIKIGLSIIGTMILNVIVTKEQRNASRVANMEAIKELSDHRHFAGSNLSFNGEVSQQQPNVESKKSAPDDKKISPALAKMLKKIS